VKHNGQDRPAEVKGQSGPEQDAKGKKPYAKPAFQCEKVFETMALACGKLSATQAQCRFNKKTS
jgi:hypothetical protein